MAHTRPQFIRPVLLAASVATCVAAAFSPVANAVELTTEQQKFSYGIGTQIGQSMKRQGVEVDVDAFAAAVRDAMEGRPPQLSPEEMAEAVGNAEKKAEQDYKAIASSNLENGTKFREDYAQEDGVKRLSNGILYKVEREGAGAQPKADSQVRVHYAGYLIDGNEFDSSYRRGEPAEFPLSGVVKGWQEVLPLMREGGKWQVVIPPELAYGARGAGAVIGPNATLVFDIELLKVL